MWPDLPCGLLESVFVSLDGDALLVPLLDRLLLLRPGQSLLSGRHFAGGGSGWITAYLFHIQVSTLLITNSMPILYKREP